MKNLFLFLWKHINLVLFLLIETGCMLLLVQNNSYQGIALINSSNLIAGAYYETINTARGYFNLRETNAMIAAENARLHSIAPGAYMKYVNASVAVSDTVYKQQYRYSFAEVINNSVHRRNNYLTLNKGKIHGIKPNSAVIGPQGVVGITKDVSDHFTTVLSVLNKDARISARIKKNGFFGSLFWDGSDSRFVTLADIPSHAGIAKGDTVVTNAFSAIFPDNILIGTIDQFDRKEGESFYSIRIRLSTNFRTIRQVYVVDNLMKEEQKKLEAASENDK